MNKKEEQFYIRGSRMAWRLMLGQCMKHLGYEKKKPAAWVLEREDAIAQLRDLCESFGNNDWPEELYLADIIEKHLAKHLFTAG